MYALITLHCNFYNVTHITSNIILEDPVRSSLWLFEVYFYVYMMFTHL